MNEGLISQNWFTMSIIVDGEWVDITTQTDQFVTSDVCLDISNNQSSIDK